MTALLREQPFFGSLALRLPVHADVGREMLASDGCKIRYAPDWVTETDAHLIETAIARVVLACALKHHIRNGGGPGSDQDDGLDTAQVVVGRRVAVRRNRMGYHALHHDANRAAAREGIVL